jgi:hypothetical protein
MPDRRRRMGKKEEKAGEKLMGLHSFLNEV